MIEFKLSNDHPLVKSLNKMLVWIKESDIKNNIVGNPDHCDLSEECLIGRITNNTPNYCWMSRFDSHEGYDFSDIQKYSALAYEEQTGRKNYILVPVAKTWYPPKGYLGWHIDQTGGRIYSAYAEGKSFFRYRDPETKEIITTWDTPGWSFRTFDFDENNPMWHCVGAEDLRISIGYRFV